MNRAAIIFTILLCQVISSQAKCKFLDESKGFIKMNYTLTQHERLSIFLRKIYLKYLKIEFEKKDKIIPPQVWMSPTTSFCHTVGQNQPHFLANL